MGRHCMALVSFTFLFKAYITPIIHSLTIHRSLLYYVFLAGATIFSTILRDTHGPSVKEDLQSLNMAATFFASLATGDGPANYAGFMTRMSATLERIARLAVDRDEKRARSADDLEEQEESPVSKRQASRIASSHQKPRRQRRGSVNRPTVNSNSNAATHPHPRQPAAPLPSSIASINARSNIPDTSIPEVLEGFPPVNSLGYVVPISPSDSSNTQTQPQPQSLPQLQTSNASNPSGLGLTDLNGANIALLNNMRANMNSYPSWQLAEDHSRSTTSPMDNTQSPYSVASSGGPGPGPGPTTMFPDSWQVPLTADWQFGEELWAGLFRTDTSGSSAPQNNSMPILNAESFLNGPDTTETESHNQNQNQNFSVNGNDNGDGSASYLGYGTQTMGYNFMPAGVSQGQDGNQDGEQDAQDNEYSQSIFSNAFLGMFP